MEKDSSNIKENKDISNKEQSEVKQEKNNKLTDRQREVMITAIVLIIAIVVGIFLGRQLYDIMNR